MKTEFSGYLGSWQPLPAKYLMKDCAPDACTWRDSLCISPLSSSHPTCSDSTTASAGTLWSEPKRRGSLRFLPPLEVRPSSVAPDQRSPERPHQLHRIPRLSEAPWEVP